MVNSEFPGIPSTLDTHTASPRTRRGKKKDTRSSTIKQLLLQCYSATSSIALASGKKKGKVCFWTLNYHDRPIFNPELQNQTSCTLQLSKPCKKHP